MHNESKTFFSFRNIWVGSKLTYILMVKYEVNILESFLFCQSKINFIYTSFEKPCRETAEEFVSRFSQL